MAGNMQAHGEIFFIDELLNSSDLLALDGKSVRISGRLDGHDCEQSSATLTDPQSNKQLRLDTALIEPFEARLGSLFQFIGELDFGESLELTLKARVVRSVDGMDLVMYRRVIDTQRRYLQSREQT